MLGVCCERITGRPLLQGDESVESVGAFSARPFGLRNGPHSVRDGIAAWRCVGPYDQVWRGDHGLRVLRLRRTRAGNVPMEDVPGFGGPH
jgi:hypothetical protein